MSKFNKKSTRKTPNKSGHPAYKMDDKERLVSAVLTTMFGEPKFYGSTDSDIVKLATDCAKRDPQFLSNLAIYARCEANMRSVSHVLTSIIAREAHEFTRYTFQHVIVRADDILEIFACYKQMYGKPFPNALKRAVADRMQTISEYEYAKYNRNQEITFKDVLQIAHPKPKTVEVDEIFDAIINDNLRTPYTWEVELSKRGNNAEVWNELIASNKLGYMAMLRNLRNIKNSGADIKPVLKRIGNKNAAIKSKQLPFRFFSAYKRLEQDGCMDNDIRAALDSALTASIENLPRLNGRTLIAVDVSGSMSCTISRNSRVRCCDIGSLLGVMASRMCEDAVVMFFNSGRSASWYWDASFGDSKGYTIKRFGKYDSIIDAAVKNAFANGGTDMHLPFKWALEEDRATRPIDRVIYLSDNECNRGKGIVQADADKYRREKNPNLWVHAIDLQGYGAQQFCGKQTNIIAGWSDEVLSFISLAENGFDNLVKQIANYEPTTRR